MVYAQKDTAALYGYHNGAGHCPVYHIIAKIAMVYAQKDTAALYGYHNGAGHCPVTVLLRQKNS